GFLRLVGMGERRSAYRRNSRGSGVLGPEIRRRHVQADHLFVVTLEALEARPPEQAWRRIKSYLRPPRAEMYDITPPILEKAYEIRNHFAALPAPAGKENHPTLSVPDVIHLATAIVMGAERFHTLDVGKRGSGL